MQLRQVLFLLEARNTVLYYILHRASYGCTNWLKMCGTPTHRLVHQGLRPSKTHAIAATWLLVDTDRTLAGNAYLSLQTPLRRDIPGGDYEQKEKKIHAHTLFTSAGIKSSDLEYTNAGTRTPPSKSVCLIPRKG